MPKFRVTVFCEQTSWGSANIIVEANNREAALRKARRNVRGLDASGVIDWQPAKSETFESTGRYDVGDFAERADDAEVTR